MDEHFPQIIQQRLGDQRGANNESFDSATKEAANICGTCQATSRAAKGKEPVNRKERTKYNSSVKPLEEIALLDWSNRKGMWISGHDFTQQYGSRQIGAGAEQLVYLHRNGSKVKKANTGAYHGNWLEFFIRLLCHYILLPATRYTTIGFTKIEQTFAALIQQHFVLLTEGAPRSIVEASEDQMKSAIILYGERVRPEYSPVNLSELPHPTSDHPEDVQWKKNIPKIKN